MFTHSSYAEGMRQLARNERAKDSTLVTWDAGEGWRGEGYYCPRRGRIFTGLRDTRNPNMFIV
jgi:hypothetical protein